MSRQLPDASYYALKAATRRLVKQAGGVEHAESRVSKSQLSDYGNPEKPSFMPIDVVADLEADVGEPVVSRVLAQLAADGKRPTGDTCDPLAHAATLMAELGRYAEEARHAVADGKIDAAELRRLTESAADIRAAADRLHSELCDQASARRPALAERTA